MKTLPVIDIAPFLSESHTNKESRQAVADAIHSACLNFGFFYLDISSYVDPAEPAELAELGRTFFKLPAEEKEIISLSNQDGARGARRSGSRSSRLTS